MIANAVKWIFYNRTILCKMAWHNYKDCCEEAVKFWTSTQRETHKSRKQNMRTTSFSCSIRRNQDCNDRCSHLGELVPFIHFGLSFLFKLRCVYHFLMSFQAPGQCPSSCFTFACKMLICSLQKKTSKGFYMPVCVWKILQLFVRKLSVRSRDKHRERSCMTLRKYLVDFAIENILGHGNYSLGYKACLRNLNATSMLLLLNAY